MKRVNREIIEGPVRMDHIEWIRGDILAMNYLWGGRLPRERYPWLSIGPPITGTWLEWNW